MVSTEAPSLRLTIASATDAAAGIRLFELRHADRSALPDFTAGSHIAVRVPNGLVRKYSLCNDPAERDRYVIAAMRQHGLNFGAEESGHIVFFDHTTTGDGLIAALQVLKIMVETGEPLSELRKVLNPFPQAKRNLRVKSKPPVEELVEAQALVKETEKKLASLGRVLLRYSGTESLIRLLIEGRDPEYIEAQADRIAEAIKAQIGE